MIEAVERSGVPVQVGFQRRFDAGHVAVRDAVAAGPARLAAHRALLHARPGAAAAPATSRSSGGIFRDCAVHDFDGIRFVTGREVVQVVAAGANKGEDFFAECGDVDTGAALLTLDDGTIADHLPRPATTPPATTCGWRCSAPRTASSPAWTSTRRSRSADGGAAAPTGRPTPASSTASAPPTSPSCARSSEVVAGRGRQSLPARGGARGVLRRRGVRAVARARRAPVTIEEVRPREDRGCADLLGRVRGARAGATRWRRTGCSPRCATPAWRRPSSARTGSCPPTRRERPTLLKAYGLRRGRRVRPGRPARRRPRPAARASTARWTGFGDAGGRLVLAAATGARRLRRAARADRRRAGRPCWPTSTASPRTRPGRGVHRHPAPARRHDRRERPRRSTGCSTGSRDPALPRHRAPAHRRHRPARSSPARPPDRIAHVHLKDVDAALAARVRAGELTYTEAVRAGHVPAARRGRRRHRRHRRARWTAPATPAGTSWSRTRSSTPSRRRRGPGRATSAASAGVPGGRVSA